MKSRKIKDCILQAITYIFSSFGLITLIAIIVFIFSNGISTLSFDLLTTDYKAETYNLKYDEYNDDEVIPIKTIDEDEYYSYRWGIALKDGEDTVGEAQIVISYVDIKSPLRNLKDQTTSETYVIKEKLFVDKVTVVFEDGTIKASGRVKGAKTMVNVLEQGVQISDIKLSTSNGGIRGSLITTLLLILMTLIIALPLGIGGAIYLSEYAKGNKITHVLRTLIDMINGVPSIIFGLVGATVFIPFMNSTIGSDGPSIMAGAMTLAIMLLPVIIRTTEESLRVIPRDLRSASLALGASKTQTIFKVVLPNAISGILTSTLLSIGKIIGESAALIYTMGTAIKDSVTLNANSTSLALHIWSIMQGENPNYKGACAISIIILIVVLILNLLVKLVSKKLNKFGVS